MDIPKPPKGCYNCMKRRIKCDRTEPHCEKCLKKGIVCPGMGIRYRFNDGIAARGRFKGKSIPVIEDPKTSSGPVATQSSNNVPKQILSAERPADYGNGQQSAADGGYLVRYAHDQYPKLLSAESGTTSNQIFDEPHKSSETDQVAPLYNFPNDKAQNFSLRLSPSPHMSLEVLDPRTRFLFTHFNINVSPIMLMFDDERNGYRHHVLPFAVYDNIVQRAVSVAAAFHLSDRMPELRFPAEAGRAAIIRKLRETSVNDANPQVFSETTWLTIILLIVADLVTGSKDVMILYRMLTPFLNGPKVEGASAPLRSFLEYQSQLIEFFARPMLSVDEGVQRLSQGSQPFSVELEAVPLHHGSSKSISVFLYNEAFVQARNIYLVRAQSSLSALDEAEMPRRIEQLKQLLIEIDPTAEGAHTLVWPYFIAAAESRDGAHRNFFYTRLSHIWKVTGYRNVLVAMNALQDIWQRPDEKWTSRLPRIGTVIM